MAAGSSTERSPPWRSCRRWQRVGGRLTVLLDGGFRRGSDIVKARALGADAVMLGRATTYGLAAGGEAGVAHAINILKTEMDRVVGLLGCSDINRYWIAAICAGRTDCSARCQVRYTSRTANPREAQSAPSTGPGIRLRRGRFSSHIRNAR